MTDFETLLDYRRAVARLYYEVRTTTLSPAETCFRFRAERAALVATHPQSPLDSAARAAFRGLRHYQYNPALRLALSVEPADNLETLTIPLDHDGPTRLRRCGIVRFTLDNQALALSLFWIEGYGGGLFLPFRDTTSGQGSYGGGRYLLDTVKHADLGQQGQQLVVDFNYAYNPSCAYDSRWSCPLAPAENRLPVPIEAGEMLYEGEL